MKIGLYHCADFSGKYDRDALLTDLKAQLPEATFVDVEPGQAYAAIVLEGMCSDFAAVVADYQVPMSHYVALSAPAALTAVVNRLQILLRQAAVPADQIQTLSTDQVKEVMPHRDPMLFVDSISYLVSEHEIESYFYADPSLKIFEGHFPGDPVFPGVLTVEAASQTANIVMMAAERYAGKVPLFASIRSAKFRRKIVPGDTLCIHVVPIEERPESGMVTFQGTVWVEGNVAAIVENVICFR